MIEPTDSDSWELIGPFPWGPGPYPWELIGPFPWGPFE